jgi:hypothetical protein
LSTVTAKYFMEQPKTQQAANQGMRAGTLLLWIG